MLAENYSLPSVATGQRAAFLSIRHARVHPTSLRCHLPIVRLLQQDLRQQVDRLALVYQLQQEQTSKLLLLQRPLQSIL